MSRHEAARHAVRAQVAAERIARTTSRTLAPFAQAYANGLVAAISKAKTQEAQRQALIRYATAAESPPALVYAIRGAAQDAEMLGARSATAEAGGKVGSDSSEAKATAHRLDAYAVDVARRMRLGMLQQALDILKDHDGTPQELAASVAAALPIDWGAPEAVRIVVAANTTVMSALSHGRMRVLRRPIVRVNLPYWFFTAILDLRTSETCMECDKVLLAAGHPWWSTHTPLLHFHCRSAIVGVTKAVAQKLGITAEPPNVEPQEGFGKLADLCKLPARPKHIDKALLDATK